MRSEGYRSWVCLCVCPLNISPLERLCPENYIMYPTGNEGQNNHVDFSETALLQRYTTSCLVWLQ